MRFSKRAPMALTASLVAGIVLAACGGGDTGGGQTPAESTSAAGGTADVTVEASEFKFDPAALDLASGSTTTVELVNMGTVEHDFTIDELDVKILATVGETVTGTVGPVESGTYEFYCSVPGHREAGMAGELTVP